MDGSTTWVVSDLIYASRLIGEDVLGWFKVVLWAARREDSFEVRSTDIGTSVISIHPQDLILYSWNCIFIRFLF